MNHKSPRNIALTAVVFLLLIYVACALPYTFSSPLVISSEGKYAMEYSSTRETILFSGTPIPADVIVMSNNLNYVGNFRNYKRIGYIPASKYTVIDDNTTSVCEFTSSCAIENWKNATIDMNGMVFTPARKQYFENSTIVVAIILDFALALIFISTISSFTKKERDIEK